MTPNYKLSIELPNGAKFSADGEVSVVREDRDTFMAAFAEALKPSHSDESAANTGIHDSVNGAGKTTPIEAGSVTLDRSLLDRLFAKDKYGTVSLRALPRGDGAEADALVALIYGAQVLNEEPQVTGSRLKKAAIQSGLHQVDRIDRALEGQIGQFVTTAGFKKGRRYGLTNPGVIRAEGIVRGILN